MSEYFLTNSKYRWLNLSCSQCCDHVEEDELDEEVEEGAALPAFDTWKDRSYLPGGLWPKIITWKKGWKLAKGKTSVDQDSKFVNVLLLQLLDTEQGGDDFGIS